MSAPPGALRAAPRRRGPARAGGPRRRARPAVARRAAGAALAGGAAPVGGARPAGPRGDAAALRPGRAAVRAAVRQQRLPVLVHLLRLLQGPGRRPPDADRRRGRRRGAHPGRPRLPAPAAGLRRAPARGVAPTTSSTCVRGAAAVRAEHQHRDADLVRRHLRAARRRGARGRRALPGDLRPRAATPRPTWPGGSATTTAGCRQHRAGRRGGRAPARASVRCSGCRPTGAPTCWPSRGTRCGCSSRYWRTEVTVSLPRIKPSASGFQPLVPVTDAEYVQALCRAAAGRAGGRHRAVDPRAGGAARRAGADRRHHDERRLLDRARRLPRRRARRRSSSRSPTSAPRRRSPRCCEAAGYEPVWKDAFPLVTG